jgi:hypothetical protein
MSPMEAGQSDSRRLYTWEMLERILERASGSSRECFLLVINLTNIAIPAALGHVDNRRRVLTLKAL